MNGMAIPFIPFIWGTLGELWGALGGFGELWVSLGEFWGGSGGALGELREGLEDSLAFPSFIVPGFQIALLPPRSRPSPAPPPLAFRPASPTVRLLAPTIRLPEPYRRGRRFRLASQMEAMS